MSKVFVNVALSLDGFTSPSGMTLQNWKDPSIDQWGAKWGALMGWILPLEWFRQHLKLGPGGETGPVNDFMKETSERIGANIMGKRMFETGEVSWPDEAPFHTPVFVLTHEKRAPWVRPGGTTFHFFNEGPEKALALARQAAGTKDVRISGGADVIQQYLRMGVVDELELSIAPVFFGSGRRLFENLGTPPPGFTIARTLAGPRATHVRYVRAAPKS